MADVYTVKWGYPVDDPESAIGAGWFVEVDGRRVAELTEPRSQPDTPFWLSYVIVPTTEDATQREQLWGLEFWHSGRAAFRSKKFGVLAQGVLFAATPPCPETHRIIARGFHVRIDPGPSLRRHHMSGFFRRIVLSDYGPPPPPDVEQLPSFCDQRVVETVYSYSKKRRAVITVDETGDYRIHSQSWDISDWKRWGKAFWYGHNTGCHTDSLDRARELALEVLGDLYSDA